MTSKEGYGVDISPHLHHIRIYGYSQPRRRMILVLLLLNIAGLTNTLLVTSGSKGQE